MTLKRAREIADKVFDWEQKADEGTFGDVVAGDNYRNLSVFTDIPEQELREFEEYWGSNRYCRDVEEDAACDHNPQRSVNEDLLTELADGDDDDEADYEALRYAEMERILEEDGLPLLNSWDYRWA